MKKLFIIILLAAVANTLTAQSGGGVLLADSTKLKQTLAAVSLSKDLANYGYANNLPSALLSAVQIWIANPTVEPTTNLNGKEEKTKEAKVIADEWRGYMPLKQHFANLEQVASDDGKNFKDIHLHIMNIKGWLRGIHHHCTKERLQGYLDEYHYRYNRRNNMDTIFHKLIQKMAINTPKRIGDNK